MVVVVGGVVMVMIGWVQFIVMVTNGRAIIRKTQKNTKIKRNKRKTNT